MGTGTDYLMSMKVEEPRMNQTSKITGAYKQSENIYDDVLTRGKWWSRLYIDFFWGVSDIALSELILSWIPDDFSGRLLDVPVGTGVFTFEKYARIPLAQIIALDYSKNMLAQAIARQKRLGLDHIHCIQGDVGDLPLAQCAFDIVLSMNGFHVFPDKFRAFNETVRVLKKGGLFIGCFYIQGEHKRSDLIVKALLEKKGWFNGPFYTKEGLGQTLRQRYSNVELYSENAMAYFRCVK